MKKGKLYIVVLLLLFFMSAFAQGASANTGISWVITCCGSEPYVHYSYTFTYPKKDPSYFIIEASSDLKTSDIVNATVNGIAVPYEIKWFIPDRADKGGQYQTMPEKIWGIKINIPECKSIPCGSVNIEFDSTRLPKWGDFYMRDGVTHYQEKGKRPIMISVLTGRDRFRNQESPRSLSEGNSLRYLRKLPFK